MHVGAGAYDGPFVECLDFIGGASRAPPPTKMKTPTRKSGG